MKKPSQFYRVWLNFKVIVQKRMLNFKKAIHHLGNISKPYLKRKYWTIYLLSFILGFYLFGPVHGYRRLSGLGFGKHSPGKTVSIETLQREIELLKKDLRKVEPHPPKTLVFNPRMFNQPALGEVVNGFTWVNSGNTWKLHNGVDIAVLPGTKIMAAAEGVVSEVNQDLDGSYSVKIQHGEGWESVYSNLSRVIVQEGERVISGIVLGTSGAVGCNGEEPSIHFGIYHDGQPVDPEKVLKGFRE